MEEYASDIHATRSEALTMAVELFLSTVNREQTLRDRRDDLQKEIERIDGEIQKLGDKEQERRAMSIALFRQYIFKHTKKDKFVLNKEDLDEFIRTVILRRCLGMTYEEAIENFKTTYGVVSNEREGQAAQETKAYADTLMGANNAKDQRIRQADDTTEHRNEETVRETP